MSAISERNRDTRYLRIISARDYLVKDLKYQNEFATEVVMQLFSCSEPQIFKAISCRDNLRADAKYLYLDFDRKWIDLYLKEYFKRKQKQDKKIGDSQLSLL